MSRDCAEAWESRFLASYLDYVGRNPHCDRTDDGQDHEREARVTRRATTTKATRDGLLTTRGPRPLIGALMPTVVIAGLLALLVLMVSLAVASGVQ